MAIQDGIAVTYATPVNADYRELLGALYAAFDMGLDPNWRIKMGVTLPMSIAVMGDTGFVLEDTATSTINIMIADHAGIGGVMIGGAAPTGNADMVVAIDPGGGVMDITPMWMVGPRTSGWASDAQGITSASLSGRSIIVSGADWLLIRNKQGVSGYTGGLFAGKYSRLDEGIGAGYCVFGGLWADFAKTASGQDHCAIETISGTWVVNARMLPGDSKGLIGDLATDGAGTWRLGPVAVAVPSGAFGTAFQNWQVVGTCPALYSGPNGTMSTQWKDGATVKAVCMDGGAWLCRSDGAVFE